MPDRAAMNYRMGAEAQPYDDIVVDGAAQPAGGDILGALMAGLGLVSDEATLEWLDEDPEDGGFTVNFADENDAPEARIRTAGGFDGLKDYLREIGRRPLLSAEQEAGLSHAIEVGLFAEERLGNARLTPSARRELEILSETGRRATDTMIVSNLRLVVSLAKKYRGRGMPFLDLVQEGNIGLIRAVYKFDYTKGYKFSTYATWWIRQAITRSMADQARAIRLPVHFVEQVNRVQAQRRERERAGLPALTPQSMATSLDITVEQLHQIDRHARVTRSIHESVVWRDYGWREYWHGEVPEVELQYLLIEENESDESLEEAAAQSLVRQQVSEMLEILSGREQDVLRYRFGLSDGREWKLEEIGQAFGVTRERIRQIESKAIARLRDEGTKFPVEWGELDLDLRRAPEGSSRTARKGKNRSIGQGRRQDGRSSREEASSAHVDPVFDSGLPPAAGLQEPAQRRASWHPKTYTVDGVAYADRGAANQALHRLLGKGGYSRQQWIEAQLKHGLR